MSALGALFGLQSYTFFGKSQIDNAFICFHKQNVCHNSQSAHILLVPSLSPYRHNKKDCIQRLMRGPVVDYRGIVDYVNYLSTCVRIRAIGYDAYDSLEVVNMLRNSGGEGIVRPVKQNNANFTAPVSALEHAVYTGHVVVDDNPITRWCFANAVLDTDVMNNTKPVKRSEYQKIDGVITMLMSLRLFLDARR